MEHHPIHISGVLATRFAQHRYGSVLMHGTGWRKRTQTVVPGEEISGQIMSSRLSAVLEILLGLPRTLSPTKIFPVAASACY